MAAPGLRRRGQSTPDAFPAAGDDDEAGRRTLGDILGDASAATDPSWLGRSSAGIDIDDVD